MLLSLASFLAFCSPSIIFNTIEVFTYLKGAGFFGFFFFFFLMENSFHRLVFQF